MLEPEPLCEVFKVKASYHPVPGEMQLDYSALALEKGRKVSQSNGGILCVT